MANSVGALVVSLGLNAAEYFQGLTKAQYETARATRSIAAEFSRISSGIKSVAAAVGIGFGAHAFKEMVQGAFDAQEELSNLGKRAGITGSELSSLSTAAKLTHTGLEDVAAMSAKVSKALLDFSQSSSKSTIVLTALGVSAKDVPGLLAKPADAVLKLAKLLDQLPEGGTKAAAQLLILGKSGGTTSAFLYELAKQTELVKKRTDEEIESAKAFNDRLTLMGIKTDELKTKFANALLPTLDAVLTAFTKLTSGAGGAADTLERLKNDGDIQEWARNGAIAIGTLAESLIAVGKLALAVGGSFKVVAADVDVLLAKTNAPSQKITGSFGFSPEEATKGEAEYQAAKKRRDAIIKAADQNYVDLIEKNGTFITDAMKKSFAMQDRVMQAGTDALANSDRNDRLNATNTAKAAEGAKKAAEAKARAVQAALNKANATTGTGDDPARKLLEGQIKALEASIARERDILSARESYLRDYYQDGYLSVAQYYDQLQSARSLNLNNIVSAIDKEIAAQELYKDKALKAADRQDAQNKIHEYRERQAKLTRDAITQTESEERARTRAFEQYGDQLSELNAKMLELAGNTAAAANIRFDVQTRLLGRQIESTGDPTGAKAQLASIKEQQNIQAQLNDKNREYQLIINGVGIAQERINLAQQSGAIGEIEALTRTSELARSKIGTLTAMADKIAAIANQAKTLNDDGTINIVKAEQLQQVEQLRLGIERLSAQTDLLKDKFNNVFAGAFSDAIFALAEGTKSFKDAAKDLGKSITSSINKIAADQIATSLFGKEGVLSGAGGIFAKIFGGSGAEGAAGAAGSATTTAAATALTGSAATLTASGASVTAAGATLTASSATLTGTAAALTGSAGILTTAGATMTAAGGILSGAGAALSAAAGLLSASAATSAASNIAGAAGKFAGLAQGGGLAGGSNFTRGGPTLVGERGPEIVNMPRGAQVIPNDVLRQRRDERQISNTFHINVMPGASTASVLQVKEKLLRAVLEAQRRG